MNSSNRDMERMLPGFYFLVYMLLTKNKYMLVCIYI